jgi:hypothetical protein
MNISGSSNTADGIAALFSNTTGVNNTASGASALLSNTTGSNNIALGYQAGASLTTGNDNIDIGNSGSAEETGTMRIGTSGTHRVTVIAGIRDSTIPAGIPVVVSRHGRLGIATSTARYKEAIEPMNRASEAILALKPVTFRYKHELDSDGIPQFGLVAEEVEKVDPDLVARDKQGNPDTVRYEAVNAMLLNEFLKQHRKVAEQSHEIANLKAAMAEMSAVLKEQAAQIQMVNEQLQRNAAAPRVVAND